MTAIRFMSWNMEWMNDLFATGVPAAFRPDAHKPQHASDGVTVAARKQALRGAIGELAPDVLVVIEGPSDPAELQLFFDDWQPGAWKTHLQKTSGSQQNVGIAVKFGPQFDADPLTPFDTAQERAFDDFTVDIDDDGVEERYRFERRPVHVQVNLAGGKSFRVLGLHLKSKGIFSAYEWSKWWQVADGNRRKILAQTAHIRDEFIEPFLTGATTKATPLLVCGDINDGPGMDASEKRLLGSGIERLMASVWRPELALRNALFESLTPNQQKKLDFESLATTMFADPIFNKMFHKEWIDHILYSPNQPAAWVKNARVADRLPDGKFIWNKYRHASDHSPVTCDVDL